VNGLRNFLSADEMKISGLMICFIIGFAYITYRYATNQPIDAVYVDLIKGIAFYVAGINGVGSIAYGFSSYYSRNSGYGGVSTIGTNQNNINTTTNNTNQQVGDLDSRI
jgi:hypothetical protein